MASDFPRSPKLLKGALEAYESQFVGPLPNIIVFQYNLEHLTRSHQGRLVGGDVFELINATDEQIADQLVQAIYYRAPEREM